MYKSAWSRILFLLVVFFGSTIVLSISFVPRTTAAPQAVNLVDIFPGITFSDPTDIANAGDGRLFIVERGGRIRYAALDRPAPAPATFLDMTDRVEAGAEKGLLGLAFHPDFADNGVFFVNYTARIGGQLTTRISRFSVSANPNLADPASEQVMLALDQPFGNHNAGDLAFGPDGYLYIALGDGGGGGDPDKRAQNVNDLLGKMLRIDIDGGGGAPDCGSGSNYTIPVDNPLVGQPGCDEIWALGLRNPWRFSFDRQSGEMFIADVGQNAIEEINTQPSTAGGVNYGWDIKEGSTCYEPPNGCVSTGLTDPIFEYGHSNGRCAITGGFVYRGSQYPALHGRYLYADFCTGEIWSLAAQGGSWQGSLTNQLVAQTGLVSTFGEDANGEVYLATFGPNGTILRLQEDTPAPILSIEKTAPAGVASGQPFSYTLTVRNDGSASAANLVISDTLPAAANYIGSGGGVLNGRTLTWTIPSLAPQNAVSVHLSVTITQTVINKAYGVIASGGYRAPWTRPVVTLADPKHHYLPFVMK